MPTSKEHRLFKRLLPFLVGISLFAFAVLPARANAGFFDSILGTSKSSYKGATPTPKPSPKVKPVAQKQKSPRPQVARKIDLPSIQLPKLNIGKTLASIGDALWPFDDIKATKTVAKKEFGGKQVGQVLGEKDAKGPGFLSKFFKGVGNAIAGVLDFLWPFDGNGQKGLAKTDGKGKAAVSSSPAAATQPKAGTEVVTELAQTGEEDTSNAVTIVVPDEIDNATLTILGNLIWGDSHADRLTLKGLLSSDILLDKSKTYTLGNSGERFKTGYFSDNIYIGDENRIGATGMNVKGSMYLETRSGGSIYLDSDSNTLYLGAGTNTLSNADNNTNLLIDPAGTGDVLFHSSANFIDENGNMTIAGTLTSTGGGTSSDSVDITPSTNIDALDITGTNITTASLIDLDPTGTTSGNIIDIDTSTAHSGAVLSIDNTGNAVWTGNIIDIATGTGDASGDIIKMTFEAGATDVQGIVVANAAASDQAGWLMKVDTTGIFTTNMFDIDLGAQLSTGDIMNVSMGSTNVGGGVLVVADAGGARTDALIDVTSASTGDGTDASALLQLNATGLLLAGSNILDINRSAGAASNAIDITTSTTASAGNLIDLNFGVILDTGDAINVALGGTAVGAQAFVATNTASTRTASMIQVDDNNNTGTVATFDLNIASTRGGLMDIDTSGIWTNENLIDITTGAQAWTANILDVNVGAANASGDVINITMDDAAVATQALVIDTAAGVQTASPVYLNWDNTTGTVAAIDIDAAGTRGGVLDIDIEAALGTEAVIAIDVADTVAATSDMIAVQLNDSLASGALVVLGADGARTDAIVDITSASVGDGNDASALMQINATGLLVANSNILDINRSAGAASNAIDVTTSATASAGNLIDLNFGTILDTGDAINVELGGTAVGAQAFVATNTASTRTASMIQVDDNNNTGTVATFDLNIASTRGGLMDIDVTGAFGTENMIDVLANAAFTSSVMDISATGSVLTGDLVSLDYTRQHVATATVDTATALAITRDLDIDDSTGGAVTLTVSAPLMTLTEAVCTPGAADVCTFSGNLLQVDANTISSGNLVDLNLGAIAHTGDAINIALGASAPAAQALVVSSTSSTATAGVIDLNVDTAAAQSATVVDITSTVGIMDGSDTFKGMNVAITGANHTGASNVIRGLDVSLTTADADAAEIGINVGDNWDLGISSTSGIGIGAQKTLTVDSATPSVAGTSHAITANLNATLYTNFTGGTAGQLLVIEVNDAFSTFDCIGSEATINCGGVDIAAAAGDILTWVYDGTIWNLVNWLDEGDAQTGADVAEYFGSTETLEPGDVVSADPTNPEYVRKSNGAYDSRLLGVVSTLPGLVIGDPNDLNQIALTGRVPVKVTNENGAIKAGDYLTSSATKAGYAMHATKAGTVVGMALADFDGEEGTVVTFVKATWFDPVEEQKRAVLAALGMGTYSSIYGGAVLGASTEDGSADATGTAGGASNLIGPAADGSLGVLAEEVDLLVHGLLTANNLKVTTAAEFEGTLIVRGLATFEGDLVVKGALSLGSLDIAGALTKTMTAGSDISAGDPVAISGANTVVRAGAGANVVGLAAHSAGAGSSVRVAVAGSVGGYSGLATGARYYVGPGGVVTTAPGGDRAVHIGIAISGSEMIVQIFEAAAPPTPPVVDTATVDNGPTVTVDDGTQGTESANGTEDQSGTGTEPAPTTPTPTPEPSPTSAEATVGEPEASPAPSAEPSPAPAAEPTPSPTP